MADNVQEKTIMTIYDSDIISESMHKINYNFELLNSKYEVDDYKLARLEKALEDKIDLYRRTSDERANSLARDLDILNDMYEGLSSHEEIQALVENAIRNAESSLQGFISEMAGQQVEKALAGYATTSYLNLQLQGIRDSISGLRDDITDMGNEYQSSSAFLDFMSNAEKSLATATLMAANSTFARNADGYYLCPDNEDGTENPSRYTSLEQFYNDNKSTVDPDNKGLDDNKVANDFIALCQRTFKTIYTEMASIRTAVESGLSTVNILTAINGPDGQKIAAAILMEANKQTGESTIKLNADKIQIDANHKLKLSASDIIIEGDRYALQSGIVMIHSDNFNLDSNGNVTANNASFTNGSFDGDIVAKTLSTNSRNTMIDELGNLTTVNASIQGDLTANTLKTNSGNTYIDSNGLLTTKRAKISGDLTVDTLSAAGGNTTIDINGNLTAKNAKISGDITAAQFLASEDVEITNENDYSGTITKNTIINGSSFNISADGTLTNGSSTRSVTGNQLYIKILDKLVNNGQNTEIQDAVMYGVPALCMQYIDSTGTPHEYVLNPNTWKDLSAGGNSDPSDMRWLHQYGNCSVLKYSINSYYLNSGVDSYKHYKGTLSSNLTGDFYIFNPDLRNTLIPGNGSSDDVYRFYVYSLGTSQAESTNLGYLQTAKLIQNSTSSLTIDKDNMNNYAAYAFKSKIDSKGGTTYCGPSQSQTRITQQLANTFGSYLQDNMSFGVRLSYYQDYENVTLPTDYGVNNLYNFISYAVGGVTDQYYNRPINNTWDLTSDITGLNYSISAEVGGTNGFVGNLPFSTGGYYTSGSNYIQDPEFNISIVAYPMINISGMSQNVTSKTKYIYGTCTAKVSGPNYAFGSGTYYQAPISISFSIWDAMDHQSHHVSAEFIPKSISMQLDFDFLFALSGDGIDFNPLEGSERSVLDGNNNTIMKRIYTFLKSFNFIENIKNGGSQNYNHVKFSATVNGTAKQSNNYGGYTTKDATLTKTTIL